MFAKKENTTDSNLVRFSSLSIIVIIVMKIISISQYQGFNKYNTIHSVIKTINKAMVQNHINSFSIINGSQLCEMVFERQFTKVKQQVKILNHI